MLGYYFTVISARSSFFIFFSIININLYFLESCCPMFFIFLYCLLVEYLLLYIFIEMSAPSSRLLSKSTLQYHQEETKMWDVVGYEFGLSSSV